MLFNSSPAKRAVPALAIFAALVSAQDAPNVLAPSEAAKGWRLLFDGKTMNGWESHNGGDWMVRDGTLACLGAAPSWLGTAESFSNYVLKLEFRGAATVNSGVFLRSQKDGQPHITGYELQIWDYQPAGYSTGSLVGSVKASTTKILGDEWNKYEVTADGDHFTVVLNQQTILDARDSKHAVGVIGLQCQKDNPIQFRNMKLLSLR